MGKMLSRTVAQATGPLLALLAALLALLAGCSTTAPTLEPSQLLRDGWFVPPAMPPEATDAMAPSIAMSHYSRQLEALVAQPRASFDVRGALIEALYRPDGLRLGYDASVTRSAAEAFEQRAGNCLSLVLMTASLARQLGLPVRFQSVVTDEEYSRRGGIDFTVGHVNIALGRSRGDARDGDWITIDFLPGADLRRQRVRPIGEATVIAMFMNNRAAEALAAGRPTEAYWWAREALRRDPAFVTGANTLGVAYIRAGHAGAAELALRYVLERDADNLAALGNLVQLLRGQGRAAEAEPLAERLAALQPQPPFWHYDRGREALARGDAAGAREHFEAELRRQPHQPEVHHQLAVALAALGHRELAARHLAIASEHSPSAGQQALYSAKLERLRAAHSTP